MKSTLGKTRRLLPMKSLFGLLLAFAIGVICRLVGIPLPAPDALLGAAIVVAMTAGFRLSLRYGRQR